VTGANPACPTPTTATLGSTDAIVPSEPPPPRAEPRYAPPRASELGSDQRLLHAGANRVVSPFVSSGRHMALVAMRPRVDDVLELETTDAASMKLEEVRVEPGSPLEGKTVGEAMGSTPVLAVRHAGGQIAPNPPSELQLRQGDLVLLLGEEELAAIRRSPAAPQD